MITKTNLAEKFTILDELWSPRVIGSVDGTHLAKIAKLQGEFVWHTHDHEDELFLVLKGHLTIELEDQTLELDAGEFRVIPPPTGGTRGVPGIGVREAKHGPHGLRAYRINPEPRRPNAPSLTSAQQAPAGPLAVQGRSVFRRAMKRTTPAAFLSLCLTLTPFLSAADFETPEPNAIGTPLPHFELPGVSGKTYTPESFEDAKLLALVFTSNHCPTAQLYEDRLIEITADYADKGVAVVAVNPNNADAVNLSELGYTDVGDSFEEMVIRAEHKGFNFPYLDDGPTQAFSRKVGPVATPHVFVYDAERKLVFQGRIDDGEYPEYITEHTLRNVLDTLLAGEPLAVATTPAFGCSVKWVEKAAAWNKTFAERLKQEPVSLHHATANDFVALRENQDSGKIRLINVWATWCAPCVAEFPDLVETHVRFRGRDFEMITIAAEYPKMEEKALSFLQKQHASMPNYIFGDTDKYANIAAIDPEWSGALPHTLVINEKGEIIYRHTGMLDFLELRRVILPALDAITPWGG